MGFWQTSIRRTLRWEMREIADERARNKNKHSRNNSSKQNRGMSAHKRQRGESQRKSALPLRAPLGDIIQVKESPVELLGGIKLGATTKLWRTAPTTFHAARVLARGCSIIDIDVLGGSKPVPSTSRNRKQKRYLYLCGLLVHLCGELFPHLLDHRLW